MLIHERDCKKTFFFFISDSKDLARYFAKFLTNEKVIDNWITCECLHMNFVTLSARIWHFFFIFLLCE